MYKQTNRRSRSGSFGNNSRRRTFSRSPFRGSKINSSRPRRNGSGNFRNGGGRNRGARKMPAFDPSQYINKNPVEETTEIYEPKHSFGSFGLNEALVRTVYSMGLRTPTPIQDQIIPEILAGRDVIGLAETGTGKTAAFLLPLIENTLKNKDQKTLILTPTRELALQIAEELRHLSRGLRIYSTTCVGGVNIHSQIRELRRTHQFLIGTPGRVLDLLNRRHFVPGTFTNVVLDEADRMLDMGFIRDIRTILSSTPKDRNTLLFSATMTDDANKLVNDFLQNPVVVSVKKKDITNSIEQDIVPFVAHTKFDTLRSLLSDPEFKRVLIFGGMKHSVEKLARQLSDDGIQAESLHGNKNHSQRQRALGKFKMGKAIVLVATDVAARGIHVNDISHVINYDLPNTFEDYIHRVGRTGRATKHGKALTFIPA